jgi:ribose 5-phosphate isomerase B
MSNPPAIAIGSDHAGLPLKAALKAALEAAGHKVLDVGTDSPASVDYPDFAACRGAAVEDGRARFGVLVCGTGHRHLDRRQPPPRHPLRRGCTTSPSARLTREHNDANVPGPRRPGDRAGGRARRAARLPRDPLRRRPPRAPHHQDSRPTGARA